MPPVIASPPPAAPLPQIAVQSLAGCEVADGYRLIGAAVNADTMYLVIDGTMHMAVGDQAFVAESGSILLMPAGLQPRIAPRAGKGIDVVATRSTLMRHGSLLVFDAAKGETATLRVFVGRVSGDLSAWLGVTAPKTIKLPESILARGAFDTLRGELDQPGFSSADLVAALMKLCLMLFVRQTPLGASPTPQAATSAGAKIARAVAAVVAEPAADHSIEALAATAGMSRASLLRHFARHTGSSPRDFVLNTRLRVAADMLRSTGMPVKQVAAAAGFSGRTHFNRAFKALYGESPADFRADNSDDIDTIMVEVGKEEPKPVAQKGSTLTPHGS